MLVEHVVARLRHRAALAPALADVLLLLDRDAPARRRRRPRRVRVVAVVLAARGVVRGARAAVLHDVVHRDPLALLDVRVADPERQLLELALVDAVVRRVLAHLLGDVPDLAHRDLAHLARDVRQVLADHLRRGANHQAATARAPVARRGRARALALRGLPSMPMPGITCASAHGTRKQPRSLILRQVASEESGRTGTCFPKNFMLEQPASDRGLERSAMSLNRAMGRAWATVCKSYQASVASSLTPYGARAPPPARAAPSNRRRTAGVTPVSRRFV